MILSLDRIRMLGNRVLVEPVDDSYRGSLFIPDTAKDAPQGGRVVAVSDEIDGTLERLHVDDYVIFSRYSGHSLDLDGTKFFAIDRSDIILVMHDDG